ncbi:uncharacterized protein EDB91DRAFT_1348121 [Suillus paluster]|uniref:uncharacterized protein n=1 Tax=Suillus paluster TaxID=48578 RepID=UPI001B85FFF7|nr:uncharacterized protein EDB91DRAFT_1348121 [Suillus paluster]KAG1736143.1 hypothetical protein EDB91DRAFT_1348121 [Suillus paluster]
MAVKPRPWGPFKPHQEPIEVLPLPSKPRTDKLLGIYNISTHIIPAANPRITPEAPVPEPPPTSKRTLKDIKKSGVEFTEQQVRQGGADHFGVTNENLLWNCVNRYAKKDKEANVGTKRTFRRKHGRSLYVIYYLSVAS